ncbi:hypothetical protein FRB94_013354 [Tulasnella sp. JGI-2019a]|nr:hypothetical protein FRB94_013354 [Tulasnella sp. JGI-2019a]KAG8991896.1 hypothetical protein FRB93_002516 [Tulasnella sp. JGI-2019a]
MPVLEFAILHLLSPTSTTPQPLPSELRTNLRRHHDIQSEASKHPVIHLRQLEDPKILYVIGMWDSVEAHATHIQGKANQELVESMKEQVDLANMVYFHLDVESAADVWKGLPLNAPAISINRHNVKPGKREEFKATFDEVKHLLEEYTQPRGILGGWRIEKETPEKDEWVLFSGFDSVDHRFGFAKTEVFERYRAIAQFCEGFALKHATQFEP